MSLHLRCLLRTARSIARRPDAFFRRGSIPCCRSRRRHSMAPLQAAACNGVSPLPSLRSRSSSAVESAVWSRQLMMNSAHWSRFIAQAMNRGVRRCVSVAWISALYLYNTCRLSAELARCAGVICILLRRLAAQSTPVSTTTEGWLVRAASSSSQQSSEPELAAACSGVSPNTSPLTHCRPNCTPRPASGSVSSRKRTASACPYAAA
mmetsp:Transcript_32720/g.72013  ORF Transcript_32720/g.72013 Transcript_32720/m.72013 type:complete len:207 (-) Transcript_32720:197-817(-)